VAAIVIAVIVVIIVVANNNILQNVNRYVFREGSNGFLRMTRGWGARGRSSVMSRKVLDSIRTQGQDGFRLWIDRCVMAGRIEQVVAVAVAVAVAVVVVVAVVVAANRTTRGCHRGCHRGCRIAIG